MRRAQNVLEITGAEIFDLDEIRVQRRIDPLQDIVPTEVICGDTGMIDVDRGHLEAVERCTARLPSAALNFAIQSPLAFAIR